MNIEHAQHRQITHTAVYIKHGAAASLALVAVTKGRVVAEVRLELLRHVHLAHRPHQILLNHVVPLISNGKHAPLRAVSCRRACWTARCRDACLQQHMPQAAATFTMPSAARHIPQAHTPLHDPALYTFSHTHAPRCAWQASASELAESEHGAPLCRCCAGRRR